MNFLFYIYPHPPCGHLLPQVGEGNMEGVEGVEGMEGMEDMGLVGINLLLRA